MFYEIPEGIVNESNAQLLKKRDELDDSQVICDKQNQLKYAHQFETGWFWKQSDSKTYHPSILKHLRHGQTSQVPKHLPISFLYDILEERLYNERWLQDKEDFSDLTYHFRKLINHARWVDAVLEEGFQKYDM